MAGGRRWLGPDSAWGRASRPLKALYVALLVVAVIGLTLSLLTELRWVSVIAPVAVVVAVFTMFATGDRRPSGGA